MLLRRQDWSPFSPEPVEFAALNFDFHPRMVRRWLESNGFVIQRQLTVSHYRIGIVKTLVSPPLIGSHGRFSAVDRRLVAACSQRVRPRPGSGRNPSCARGCLLALPRMQSHAAVGGNIWFDLPRVWQELARP